MYAKRIQIRQYGPINHIDITFPFSGENPKPILLVGENGSGKSLLLSHIVNALMIAQGVVYPANSEVEKGRWYKVLSPLYIKSGSEYYWTKVDFERGLYREELQLIRPRKQFLQKPEEFISKDLWDSVSAEEHSGSRENLNALQRDPIKDVFENNCILYFPPNRFEEPAWLNEENLNTEAKYMNLRNIEGYSDRKIINYSPLQDNQNWIFNVFYDRCAFEAVACSSEGKNFSYPFTQYSGPASTLWNTVLDIVRKIFQKGENFRVGIGKRQLRTVALVKDDQTFVSNIFQCSSGETSLLNLFLSILRDFDLSRGGFTEAENMRGIVIVDEIDLHLHSIYQYEILPALIKMFPRVQFIVTTHSPLFALGMEKTFGSDGFALYQLPQGRQISAEEFREFGDAYKAYRNTGEFLADMQAAIQESLKPIVVVEGKTDLDYIAKSAERLGRQDMHEKFKFMDGGGVGNFKHIGTVASRLWGEIPQKVILLYDCEREQDGNSGNVLKRTIPFQEEHPIKKGIENLFERATVEKARRHNGRFFKITDAYKCSERGESKQEIPEEWEVHKDEKTNLCNWLCKKGTEKDFKHFGAIFDLLRDVVDGEEPAAPNISSNDPTP